MGNLRWNCARPIAKPDAGSNRQRAYQQLKANKKSEGPFTGSLRLNCLIIVRFCRSGHGAGMRRFGSTGRLAEHLADKLMESPIHHNHVTPQIISQKAVFLLALCLHVSTSILLAGTPGFLEPSGSKSRRINFVILFYTIFVGFVMQIWNTYHSFLQDSTFVNL
ncbi:MAG: hypothetical protein LBR29_12230 [Methylobacteriaceae bacterium]|jgi:hypothetical protein|nr:hypothetical protein [Methylobacteriaceae bacterium]